MENNQQDKNSFKTLRDIGDISGKRVLLRLDLNVPIQDGKVTDDFRIRQSMETLDFLRKGGAKVIIIAHLENKEHPSLDIVAKSMNLSGVCIFVKDPFDVSGADVLKNLNNGDVVIVENIRNWEGEKKNNEAFAEKLASLADFYVNEAFSVSHRAHASIVGVPKFLPSFAGFGFEREVTSLSKAFHAPSPYLFILGGAKFETKVPLITKFLKLADTVFVGGALANDLLKAKGYEIGGSVHSDQDFGFADMLKNPKLVVPFDVLVVTETGEKAAKKADAVLPTDKIWDVGPETIAALQGTISRAKFILWNGPVGLFEQKYTEGTFAIAKMVAQASGKKADGTVGAESVVGGGDTLASIEALGLGDKFTFISTAGGAMLDFLANETLPGIEALHLSK